MTPERPAAITKETGKHLQHFPVGFVHTPGSNHVAHQNLRALSGRNTKHNHEADHTEDVSVGRKRSGPHQRNHIQHCHLRQIKGEEFPTVRHADAQNFFIYRERNRRDAMEVQRHILGPNHQKHQQRRDTLTEHGGDCDPFHTQNGNAERSEDEAIVADDV